MIAPSRYSYPRTPYATMIARTFGKREEGRGSLNPTAKQVCASLICGPLGAAVVFSTKRDRYIQFEVYCIFGLKEHIGTFSLAYLIIKKNARTKEWREGYMQTLG